MLLRIFTEEVKGHCELETPFGSSSLVHPPSQPFQTPALLSFRFCYVTCGPPKLPPSWHLARFGFLYLFMKLFMPLPQDCERLQIKGRWRAAFSRCVPAADTQPGRGRHWLLGGGTRTARSALLSSHSPGLGHRVHALFPDHPSPLNPALVFLSFSLGATSSYRSYSPPRVTPAVLVPCPGTPSTFALEPASYSLPSEGRPVLSHLAAPSCTFSVVHVLLSGACSSSNMALEKLGFTAEGPASCLLISTRVALWALLLWGSPKVQVWES